MNRRIIGHGLGIRLFGLTVIALVTVSCGDDDNNDDAGPEGQSTDVDAGNGEGDTDTEETPPKKSAGCGQTGDSPPAGELTVTIEGEDAAYLVTLPDDYDGETPLSLVFAFHGATRTHMEMYNVDAAKIKTALGGTNVMVYPKSQGGPAWTGANELAVNISLFETLYEKMLDNYCIDENRVFATGLSSGGGFTNILACRYADKLRAVGPVSSFMMETDCTVPIASMVIHGVRDSVVPPTQGEQARDHYVDLAECDDTTVAADIEPCVFYEGCNSATPVGWCQHDEPTYENTNHGWPSFASEALADFFANLP